MMLGGSIPIEAFDSAECENKCGVVIYGIKPLPRFCFSCRDNTVKELNDILDSVAMKDCGGG